MIRKITERFNSHYWTVPLCLSIQTVYVNNYVYDANGTLYTGTIERVEGKGLIGVTEVQEIRSY